MRGLVGLMWRQVATCNSRRSGSVGAGDLSYAWDLDGDGIFETVSDGPTLTVKPAR